PETNVRESPSPCRGQIGVPKVIHESDVEENVLSILASLGYEIIKGDNEEYLPGGRSALRADYKDVVLVERLREALRRINPSITEEAREQALKQVLRSQSQKLIEDNESFHKMLVDRSEEHTSELQS